MAGTWTTSIQTRQDSENYIPGVSSGTYNVGDKISAAITNTTASTTQTGTISVPGVATIANLQSFFLLSDTGTVANPVVVTFTLSTGTKVIDLVAGVPYYWDVNVGTVNPFSYAIVGPTAAYSIPGALGLAAGAVVNITGRVATS